MEHEHRLWINPQNVQGCNDSDNVSLQQTGTVLHLDYMLAFTPSHLTHSGRHAIAFINLAIKVKQMSKANKR